MSTNEYIISILISLDVIVLLLCLLSHYKSIMIMRILSQHEKRVADSMERLGDGILDGIKTLTQAVGELRSSNEALMLRHVKSELYLEQLVQRTRQNGSGSLKKGDSAPR